jgi:putative ABC transport system permease protein
MSAVIHEIDPGLAVFGVEPMEATLARSVQQRRFMTLLLASFASMSLLLAAVGIHGVLSYSVSQRGREIGIRMALGAGARDMVALIVREGLGLTAAGLGLGLIGALVLTRLLASQLYGVAPTDPVTFGAVTTLLALVALAATAAPARRAAAVNPLDALKSDR